MSLAAVFHSAAHAESVNVFAAASLKTALDDIATVWKTQSGKDIVATYGSTAPVSVPSAATHSSAVTAAADPPEDPPGIRSVSHGLRVTPNAEFSVELPIANSSIFNRPKMIAPAARNRSMTVASYGEIKLPRIFDAQFSR